MTEININTCIMFMSIIQLCKHVVAKVTLVPCSVNLTGKRDKVGHGEVTINNARIIHHIFICFSTSHESICIYLTFMIHIICKWVG